MKNMVIENVVKKLQIKMIFSMLILFYLFGKCIGSYRNIRWLESFVGQTFRCQEYSLARKVRSQEIRICTQILKYAKWRPFFKRLS